MTLKDFPWSSFTKIWYFIISVGISDLTNFVLVSYHFILLKNDYFSICLKKDNQTTKGTKHYSIFSINITEN